MINKRPNKKEDMVHRLGCQALTEAYNFGVDRNDQGFSKFMEAYEKKLRRGFGAMVAMPKNNLDPLENNQTDEKWSPSNAPCYHLWFPTTESRSSDEILVICQKCLRIKYINKNGSRVAPEALPTLTKPGGDTHAI